MPSSGKLRLAVAESHSSPSPQTGMPATYEMDQSPHLRLELSLFMPPTRSLRLFVEKGLQTRMPPSWRAFRLVYRRFSPRASPGANTPAPLWGRSCSPLQLAVGPTRVLAAGEASRVGTSAGRRIRGFAESEPHLPSGPATVLNSAPLQEFASYVSAESVGLLSLPSCRKLRARQLTRL